MAGTAGLLVVAALSACSFNPFAKPTVTELTGAWINGATRLNLMDDGTFTLENAPIYTDPSGDQNWQSGIPETYDWTGKWNIESYGLVLSPTSGNGSHLSFSQSAGEWVLDFAIDAGSGDPRCSELVRDGSDTVPREPKDCVIY